MQAFADDDLGAAAADIGDQASSRLAGHRLRDAKIDQARFFDAGDDFDGMTERGARAIEKGAFALAPCASVFVPTTRTLSAFMSRRR